VQRPLWASTSTKNPSYPDTLYVDPLIGPHTVNTMPEVTLEAFEKHGTVARTADVGYAEARNTMAQLAVQGVSIDDVTNLLEEEGVASFSKSFDELMTSLQTKADDLASSGS
jgi:transaldolase